MERSTAYPLQFPARDLRNAVRGPALCVLPPEINYLFSSARVLNVSSVKIAASIPSQLGVLRVSRNEVRCPRDAHAAFGLSELRRLPSKAPNDRGAMKPRVRIASDRAKWCY
ncbi:hypothetical protein [Burkholderia arboris]|uniref:hypothetical protein n=1 Tax=Burkholderia arboris TaxID=488730 RepID=UPI0015829B21|nr:hypothetical protein [Burkholderia arboris]